MQLRRQRVRRQRVTRHLGRVGAPEAPQGTKGSERALWVGGAS